jgi:hypothetical protein
LLLSLDNFLVQKSLKRKVRKSFEGF